MRIQNPRQKELRKGRFSQKNQIYHITTATANREPIFKDLYLVRKVINTIKLSDSLAYTTTLAFVIMPDHIHWLIQLGDKVSLQQLVRSMKSQTAKVATKPIWQAGYYDHAIRKDEDIIAIARYIIANPIRAGLVKRVGDYPHWYAVWVSLFKRFYQRL
jgi:putative transposase